MASAWICEVCKKPIEKDGFVAVYNVDRDVGPIGAYPTRASDNRVEPQDSRVEGEMPRIRSLAEVVADKEPTIRIGFAAYHTKCDPQPERSPYHFPATRAATLEQWCSWVLHLGDKTWFGREDILRMINYYFHNRGIDVDSLT
jgi:hypothetical protein